MSLLAGPVDIQANFFSSHPNAQTPFTSPGSLLTRILPNAMILGGVLFFFYIIWGGWDIVFGAGSGGNPTSMQKAWRKLTFGLIGFLIVVGSFFILQIIETLTGIDIINPPTI